MDDDERRAFLSRIGTFFILLGLLLLVLFVASDIGSETYFSYFFIGIIMLSVGFFFKRTNAPPPSPGKRFERIRKIQQKRRETKEMKEAAKKKR